MPTYDFTGDLTTFAGFAAILGVIPLWLVITRRFERFNR